MTKIKTRPSLDDTCADELIAVLAASTHDQVGPLGSPAALQIEPTFEAALGATGQLLHGLTNRIIDQHKRLREQELERAKLETGYGILSARLELVENMLENLVGQVDYDEALDLATTDFMEALIAADCVEPTGDGDIVFPKQLLVTKSTLKSVVRAAIVSWIEKKVSE